MRTPEARVPGISPWSSQEAHPTQRKHIEGQHIILAKSCRFMNTYYVPGLACCLVPPS